MMKRTSKEQFGHVLLKRSQAGPMLCKWQRGDALSQAVDEISACLFHQSLFQKDFFMDNLTLHALLYHYTTDLEFPQWTVGDSLGPQPAALL